MEYRFLGDDCWYHRREHEVNELRLLEQNLGFSPTRLTQKHEQGWHQIDGDGTPSEKGQTVLDLIEGLWDYLVQSALNNYFYCVSLQIVLKGAIVL